MPFFHASCGKFYPFGFRTVKKTIRFAMFVILMVLGAGITLAGDGGDTAGPSQTVATDPLSATYTIAESEIRLIGGRSELQAAPGSAMRTKTLVFGKPVYGDLDGDGDEDAAVILVQDPGGSGTFYYIGAALGVKGGYRGTNAVLLGDRVAPLKVDIRNGLIFIDYRDRRPEEPMAIAPSVGKSAYLTLGNGNLTPIKPLEKGEQVLQGWVTIGHEVRSFAPCSQADELWLIGNSPALSAIVTAYRETLPKPIPYSPLFMVLAGKVTTPVTSGFGTKYTAAFYATQLVRAPSKGSCDN
jgi:hypothetical protein